MNETDVIDLGGALESEYRRQAEDEEDERVARLVAEWQAAGADPARWPFHPGG